MMETLAELRHLDD